MFHKTRQHNISLTYVRRFASCYMSKHSKLDKHGDLERPTQA
jgi:hypothetical protein